MTTFDRVAWTCSWLAPAGWLLALAAFSLSLVIGRPAATVSDVSTSLPAVALAAASLGLIAHTILGYHVLKARAFTPEERSRLWRDYLLGLGYRRWRRTMRSHQAS